VDILIRLLQDYISQPLPSGLNIILSAVNTWRQNLDWATIKPTVVVARYRSILGGGGGGGGGDCRQQFS